MNEQEKQKDCSCPKCGTSGFDGFCSWCKHKTDKGVNFYTDEPVVLKEITDEQQEELNEMLTEDILERYNNSEYWDSDLIMEYYANHHIKY